jgi:hypothetical protein
MQAYRSLRYQLEDLAPSGVNIQVLDEAALQVSPNLLSLVHIAVLRRISPSLCQKTHVACATRMRVLMYMHVCMRVLHVCSSYVPTRISSGGQACVVQAVSESEGT